MFRKAYKDWADKTNQRQKLQTIYTVVALTFVFVAGLVSLLDQSLGLTLLNIAYISAVVWVVNFVTWAIYLAVTTPANNDTKPTNKRNR